MLNIYIDGDGCPVKPEVFRVAHRHDLKVFVVSNSWTQVPSAGRVEAIRVDDQFDAADDWIVEHATENDIVTTSDIPLASRCIKKGIRVLGPKGNLFTDENIGEALANRDLMAHLRESGIMTRGPAPFEKKDRSRFLQSLHELILSIQRA
ncbi:MAG: YaiI/YqxD family protein [Planctomycetota bacterium]